MELLLGYAGRMFILLMPLAFLSIVKTDHVPMPSTLLWEELHGL
jgi:hypothetical protein